MPYCYLLMYYLVFHRGSVIVWALTFKIQYFSAKAILFFK